MPKYQPDEAPAWSSEANYDDEYTGTLYITNKRLLFERKVGFIRKRGAIATEVPLRNVTGASIEKGPWDWTVLVIVAGGQKHRFLFRARSPDDLIKRLGELLPGQKETGEGARPPPT